MDETIIPDTKKHFMKVLFHEELPDTKESIRYHMPSFTLEKNRHLYFVAYNMPFYIESFLHP